MANNRARAIAKLAKKVTGETIEEPAAVIETAKSAGRSFKSLPGGRRTYHSKGLGEAAEFFDKIKSPAELLEKHHTQMTDHSFNMGKKYLGKAGRYAQVPLSGRGQNFTKYLEENRRAPTIDEIKAAAGMKPKNVKQYIYQKAANKGMGYNDMLGNEENYSRVAKGIGMEEKTFAALDQEGKTGAIADWVKTERNRDANLIDKAGYHKVPQKILGTAVLGGTVLAMSGSRGRQSNAQLYGQQQ